MQISQSMSTIVYRVSFLVFLLHAAFYSLSVYHDDTLYICICDFALSALMLTAGVAMYWYVCALLALIRPKQIKRFEPT